MTKHPAAYWQLLKFKSYRRRVTVSLLAFFGATVSVAQLILWVSGVPGGAALAYTLVVLIPIGVTFALRASLPSADVLFRHAAVGSNLRLLVGNLFNTSDATIVVTMNRYFDTSSKWVSRDSLIGQLLAGPFAGKSEDLRNFILAQLHCKIEEERPVGDILSIRYANVSYLFIAVADRNEETRSTVAVDAVWTSLSRLWQYARQQNLSKLRLPVIGSGYARGHVGRIPMLILLLTSYLTSAMETPICDLEIVLHPDDADPDLLELAKTYGEILGYKSLDQRSFTETDLALQSAAVSPSEPFSSAFDMAESHVFTSETGKPAGSRGPDIL